MKTKLLIPTLLIASALSMPVMATTTTFGVTDCGSWIKDKSTTKKTWLLGFITGLNFADRTNSDHISKLSSAEQIYLWVDNYCRKNPLDDLVEAGVALYVELAKKK